MKIKTKYLAVAYPPEVSPREILNETRDYYEVRPRRGSPYVHSKSSPSHRYFDTWDEAHKWLVRETESAMRHHAERLNAAKQRLSKVLEMKP